ncbi:MAG TPA: biotin--[acetyl-CoA-carboxylase] ligase, partial [Bacteroidetes bacterium]|nr:biotin--[acetyl-CoA-carboxylase] ligase [Bacteroidota bacterium]
MLGSTFKIQEFDSILSTNEMMRSLVRKHDVDPFTVIMAQEQIAGKGQRGRKWVSEKGKNLLCSLFYKPEKMEANEQFILTQLISVSIVEAIKTHIIHSSYKLSIKWPNDIYVGDRKLAGILIENAILGNYIQYSIIGVGLNINQEDFSDELPNPVSLFQLSEKKQDIKSVLKEIIKYFEINR